FSLEKKEILGILGESGCGKSLTGFALLRLFPPGINRYSGEVIINGLSLYDLPEKEVLKLRGRKVAIILQDPLSSLNPVLTIGEQIEEVLKYHFNLGKNERKERVIKLLNEVGIPDPEIRIKSYPHQLSGGLRQRAMIAMALAGEPELLVADEPTTALDVTLQTQILELLYELNQKKDLTIVFISHDLGIIRWIASKVCVFYAGEIVEMAKTEELFNNPLHPYTQTLIESYPKEGKIRKVLRGGVVNLLEKPKGCRYFERCEITCKEGKENHPELISFKEEHWVRCFKYE
ncbi:MAG: peptide ABC transporter ATP-binding protein, partial [Thermodesulfobacterium geofontis]